MKLKLHGTAACIDKMYNASSILPLNPKLLHCNSRLPECPEGMRAWRSWCLYCKGHIRRRLAAVRVSFHNLSALLQRLRH